jgi:hypothetical protein
MPYVRRQIGVKGDLAGPVKQKRINLGLRN